jgi:hypothetical protein
VDEHAETRLTPPLEALLPLPGSFLQEGIFLSGERVQHKDANEYHCHDTLHEMSS